MKLRDLKRARVLNWRDIAEKTGVFASFLMVTVLSLYAWSPAKESSAFDWNTVDGSSPYIASLSGSDEIRISATPSASQAVFDQDDTLELTSTCPYGAAIYLNMDSSESNALSRTGSDEGIKTISATTGTALNDNSWGYSLDDGSTYLPMPLSTGTPVSIYNSEQVESNTEITVKYGMKIDSSIPSGYYSGNVLYSTVANPSCSRYTLSFNTDGGTEIDDVQLTYGQLIDLSDYETTKDGFDLAGWDLVGTDTTFAADETNANVNPSDALNVVLRAKWATSGSIFDIMDMQDMTPELCQSTTTPDKTATQFDWDGSHAGDTSYVPRTVLTDTRDQNRYLVSKLADGNCWMSQNLALDLSNTKALTDEKTDLNSKSTWTPENSTQTALSGSWPSDMDLGSMQAYSYHPITTDRYYREGKTKSETPTGTSDEYLWESTGNYYNWYSATAGSGTLDLTYDDLALDSICPKGWRLPFPTGVKSASNLFDDVYNITSQNIATVVASPLNFVYSGTYNPTSNNMSSAGSSTALWLPGSGSVSELQKRAQYVNITSSRVTSVSGRAGFYGASIRCIARGKERLVQLDPNNGEVFGGLQYALISDNEIKVLPEAKRNAYHFLGWFTEREGGEKYEDVTNKFPIERIYAHWEKINPIQTFSCSTLNAGDVVWLYDTRDYSDYKVGKLADGRCWMLDNLRLTGKVITSEDSNLPNNTTFSIPERSLSNFTSTDNVNAAYYHKLTNSTYYPAYTATAGWATRGVVGYATQDICPKGWRLPVSTYGSDFGTLSRSYSTLEELKESANYYTSGTVRPPNATTVTLSGMALHGSLFNDNEYIFTLGSTTGSGELSTISFQNISSWNGNYGMGYGLAIRCIAKLESEESSKKISDISYMQEMTPNICESSNVGDTAILTDNRDGNQYSIKKLKDNQCWMTKNLRIANKTISSADSNIPDNTTYTVPVSNSTATFSSDGNNDEMYLDTTYGGYYNFHTATAGWGSTNNTEYQLSPRDICPKGWKLPSMLRGISNEIYGEAWILTGIYTTATSLINEAGFDLGGQVKNGMFSGQNSIYFTSGLRGNNTFDTLTASRYNNIDTANVSLQNGSNPMTNGYQIRCVARQDI